MATSFHQSLRRFLRSSAAPTAAALLVTGASTTRLEEAVPEPSQPKQPVEFVGVFLAKDSAAQLKQRYPAKFATADDGTLFLVLKFNPSEQEKEAFAPILGSAAQLQIKGYAEDDTTQAVLVSVTTRDGEPLEYDSGAEHAHITLSSAEGTSGLNAGYSNVLFERLRASDKLRVLLDDAPTDADAPREWTGELPAFASAHFPLYSPFPASSATVVRGDKATTDSESESAAAVPLQLQGTVCMSSAYDAATGACASASGKPECGFCKFMKAGPCGREFSAWEACLDQSKKDGADFIERCGAPTLALRDCVDANPEYYSVLNDPPAEDDA